MHVVLLGVAFATAKPRSQLTDAVFSALPTQLVDALKSNTNITSVDLSHNHISDEGAQAIAAMLAMNGAPELIELDLRDNNLTAAGLTVLVRG